MTSPASAPDDDRGEFSTIFYDVAHKGSWIRRMLDVAIRLKKERGADKVFNFTLGNPTLEPPAAVLAALRAVAADTAPGMHKYMDSEGYPESRAKVAELVNSLEEVGDCPVTLQEIVLTMGAAGALAVLFRAVLADGDEVVVPAPYFEEYPSYVDFRCSKMVAVPPLNDDFDLDVAGIERAITERTRVVLICSPSNPTGRICSQGDIDRLADVLRRKSAEHGRPIYLVNDQVYRRLIFDPVLAKQKSRFLAQYDHALIAGSFSKDMSLAGERIGYLCVNPNMAHKRELAHGLATALDLMGFVNAPAVMQRVIAITTDPVDAREYQARVEALHRAVVAAGLECARPQGGFFLFPKVPGGHDSVEFANFMAGKGIVVVPGVGSGSNLHFRVSASVPLDVISNSAPVWITAVAEFKKWKRVV